MLGGIHPSEGLTLETSVFESFVVANLPYRPYTLKKSAIVRRDA